MNGGLKSFGRGRRRSFAADRAGAAEMIGDILLVVMSVFMVSLLALQLSSVQSPTESLRVDLEATLRRLIADLHRLPHEGTHEPNLATAQLDALGSRAHGLERWSHAMAGATLTACAGAILFLGL